MIKNFIGYHHLKAETKVKDYKNTDKFTFLILEQTCFFAESAGQIGDSGILIINGLEYPVLGLVLDNDEVIHKIALVKDIEINVPVVAKIDAAKRKLVSANHSAAHLLFDTLREQFPSSIGKGYFNDENGLRIDMWIEEEMTSNIIEAIQNIVANKIASNSSKEEIITDAQIVQSEYNLDISFGNKELKGELRIVKFGDVSIQLCSGTHVDNTSDIPDFYIYNFESKGNNVYRFYAKTSLEQIEQAIKQTLEQEQEEIKALTDKYEMTKSKMSNLEIESLISAIATKELSKATFFQWKTNLILLKSKIKEHYIQFEKIKRDNYIQKYSEAAFVNIDNINYLEIKDDTMEIKDMNFVADWLMKSNSNALIELVNLNSKIYLCKSNSSKSAIETMKNHASLSIKGGGNEKTAQGKIT
ncbi:hypothetical protein CXP39_02965 [Mesoplasma syrphidae]|uniref:Alanyl-transfer RNA synthetases family profile domain-containing protein n=1 Tax=Mesoplasma syrphidae TaxID=225999 RepID=A0A2K9BKI4_9MOLU|nr:alanine--tRNA ligase-related protein [Mesoplasma syrphidae]AUF83746.1 hypothetical protein CXP39_02965 [Mesoplasma syrphidae]